MFFCDSLTVDDGCCMLLRKSGRNHEWVVLSHVESALAFSWRPLRRVAMRGCGPLARARSGAPACPALPSVDAMLLGAIWHLLAKHAVICNITYVALCGIADHRGSSWLRQFFVPEAMHARDKVDDVCVASWSAARTAACPESCPAVIVALHQNECVTMRHYASPTCQGIEEGHKLRVLRPAHAAMFFIRFNHSAIR